MVRNCCLSLCQFEIPLEILFDYGRVARLLVAVLQHHNSDHLTQRIVVFLLNSMACHVEGEQKVQVGNIGAIEVSLSEIFFIFVESCFSYYYFNFGNLIRCSTSHFLF